MSADRFTPPPYTASEPGDYGDYDGRCFVICGDDLRIAVVLGDHQEARANAALFTAAPELLDALKESERLYSSYGLLAQHPECGKWINAARAAIAKASPPKATIA